MKIKFNDYLELVEKNHDKVLFIPIHLQTLFGLSETVCKEYMYNLISNIKLTRTMCAYLNVDENLEGLTGYELYTFVYNFNSYFKPRDEYEKNCNNHAKHHILEIKHPVLDDLVSQAMDGNNEAVETLTRMFENFDPEQLVKELEVPEFSDSSDDETVSVSPVSPETCSTVLVSQGEYSDREIQTVATFRNPNRARKFVKRLDKVVHSCHPLDESLEMIQKFLEIHPNLILVKI